MKNQLRGIALIIFAVLIVVIGIAMTPDLSATFANITAIIGGLIGLFGLVLAFEGGSEDGQFSQFQVGLMKNCENEVIL